MLVLALLLLLVFLSLSLSNETRTSLILASGWCWPALVANAKEVVEKWAAMDGIAASCTTYHFLVLHCIVSLILSTHYENFKKFGDGHGEQRLEW